MGEEIDSSNLQGVVKKKKKNQVDSKRWSVIILNLVLGILFLENIEIDFFRYFSMDKKLHLKFRLITILTFSIV